MSGRARVTLADGRRVTGFRKTLRVNRRAPRTPDWQLPDWRLSFLLPDDMRFFGLEQGLVRGIIGVRIERIGFALHCVAAAKNREFCIRQCVEFLRSVAPDYRAPINATLERSAEPHPSAVSGPGRRAETHPCQIRIGGGQSSITFATSMRSMTW